MKALVTAEFPEAGLAELRALGFDAQHRGWGVTRRALDRDELIEALRGVHVLISEIETVDETVMAACPDLRLVAACRGEPTNVDLEAAARRGITVLHTPGRNAISVADFTMALILHRARRLGEAEVHLREHGWLVGEDLPYFHFRGRELAGKILGIVGLGAIGRLVAQRASGFGMEIVASDPFIAKAPRGIRLTELDELLVRSHVVSIHCPLTPSTRGMIGVEQLARMRPDSLLVNTARADVVDESALIEALRARRIAGAALDVFWTEPPARDHPIFALDRVTLTPHVAGASDDVPSHHARIVLDDIRRWLDGLPLLNAAVPPLSPARVAT